MGRPPLGDEGRATATFTIFSAFAGAFVGGALGYLMMTDNPVPVYYNGELTHVSEYGKVVGGAIVGSTFASVLYIILMSHTPAHDEQIKFTPRKRKNP